jgi:steroid delta-isomerase-like uncharacterized protein
MRHSNRAAPTGCRLGAPGDGGPAGWGRGSRARRNPPPPVRPAGVRSRPAAAAFCLLTILSVVALTALGAELALAYRTPTLRPDDREAAANAALIVRFYAEVWNGGRLTNLDRFVAADHRYHDPTTVDVPVGPRGVAQVVAGLRQAMPDLVLSVDDVVAQEAKVVVRFTLHGTHRGPLFGAEATNRAVQVTGTSTYRFADRQLAETWVSLDTFGLALQVGLIFVPVSALDGADGWEGAPAQEQPGKPY